MSSQTTIDHAPVDSAGPPATPVHRLPGSYVALYWLVAAAGGTGLAAAWAVPWLVPGSFDALYLAAPLSVAAGLVALYGGREALRMRERFMADADGLVVLRPGGETERVPWVDVVGARSRLMLQQLELRLRDGRTLHLEFKLTDFEFLAAMVGRMVAHGEPAADARPPDEPEPGSPAPGAADPPVVAGQGGVETYHGGRARWALPALVPVVVLGSAAVFGGVLLLAWAASLALLWAWAMVWRELSLERGALVVDRPFRVRRIPAAEVVGVELVMTDAGNGNQRPEVVVVLASGELLRFAGVREGEIRLYGALSQWKERWS